MPWIPGQVLEHGHGVGQYNDKLIRENGEWLFKERIYNFDGEIDPSLSDAMKELFKDKPSER